MSTTEDQIKKMYSSQLASQKEQLKQGYMQADAEYAAEKEKAQKVTDANLTRTAVEAQKAAVNNAELHNAYGLSSGTRAQARLAQENQLQADLTALRMQQQELDTDVERQRTLLSQQYQSAIREAQAENDLAKAQALYEEAQRQQDALLARQQATAAQKQAQDQRALEAAKLMAEAGDYTRLAAIYGLSPAELKVLMGEPTNPAPNPSNNTGTVDLNSIYYDDNVPTTGASGSTAKPTAQPQTDNLVLDQNSIIALGFGAISAETLNKLIEQGVVEEYAEGGKLKFRKTAKGGGMPYSAALMPNR